MNKIIRKLLGKFNIAIALMLAIVMAGGFGGATYVLASGTSTFGQTINVGTLSTDIVDAAYSSVASPAVAMNAVTFSFAYQTATGSFGSATEQIYVSNSDAADGGWTLAVAPSATTAFWDSAGTDFDFNDSTASAGDGADTDTLGGQMTVDPSVATLATSTCASCVITNITKGASTAYVEGATNSVTLLTAAVASDDIGKWTLQGVSISQTIPAEQPAASDYTLNMVLTVTAT
ncbi:hypothetical protein KKH96_00140 [Patescibacteria group bacterium]|nr:hypothetical protein [Patescibacteria group bacterium]